MTVFDYERNIEKENHLRNHRFKVENNPGYGY